MAKFEWLFGAQADPAARKHAKLDWPIVERRVGNNLIHPPADWNFPRRTIMIVGMPRSGTSYFCQAMMSTGVLGRPTEFFDSKVAAEYDTGRAHDVAFRLTLPNTYGRSDNAIAAVKFFDYSLDDISRQANIMDFYPNPIFVYMHRRDILGQALSLARAEQTRSWKSDLTAEREPYYSADEIHRALLKTVTSEARWKAYFARNDIEPLDLCYEDMLGNEATILREIARRAGLDASEASITLESPDLPVQRDALTAKWRARFIAERADLNWIERYARKRVSHKPRNFIWSLLQKLSA
jgi:LPS sulfotransferase NodH